MPTTEPIHGFPIPEDGDPLADGAAAIRAAVTQIGYTVPSVDPRGANIEAGTQSVTMDGGSEQTGDVTFHQEYATPPVVVCTSRAFSSRRYVVTHVVRTTGFTYWVNEYTGASGNNDASFQWIAIGQLA